MSSSGPKKFKTFIASEDMSSAQYFAVVQTDEKTVALAGANEKACGFIQNSDVTSGRLAEVAMPGDQALAILTETTTINKFLTPTSTGELEVVDAAGEFCCAICRKAGVDGDVVPVDVVQFTAHASDA